MRAQLVVSPSHLTVLAITRLPRASARKLPLPEKQGDRWPPHCGDDDLCANTADWKPARDSCGGGSSWADAGEQQARPAAKESSAAAAARGDMACGARPRGVSGGGACGHEQREDETPGGLRQPPAALRRAPAARTRRAASACAGAPWRSAPGAHAKGRGEGRQRWAPPATVVPRPAGRTAHSRTAHSAAERGQAGSSRRGEEVLKPTSSRGLLRALTHSWRTETRKKSGKRSRTRDEVKIADCKRRVCKRLFRENTREFRVLSNVPAALSLPATRRGQL